MQKNAFTLIELLAVLVILGILVLMIMPTIEKTMKRARENLYDLQIENIRTGAKNWAAENIIILPEHENEIITLTLGQLKIGNFVTKDISSPKTNQLFPNDMEIIIKKGIDDYEYIVIEDSGGFDDSLDYNTPLLTLNGLVHEIVEINSIYEDDFVIARTPSGSLIDDDEVNVKITSNGVVVPNIDTSLYVQYKIKYTVIYNSVSASVIRTVTIRDTIPPILIIPNNIILSISQVGLFNIMEGVSATDNSEENPAIIHVGEVHSVPGKYYIEYIATDSSGNSVSKIRVITVIE